MCQCGISLKAFQMYEGALMHQMTMTVYTGVLVQTAQSHRMISSTRDPVTQLFQWELIRLCLQALCIISLVPKEGCVLTVWSSLNPAWGLECLCSHSEQTPANTHMSQCTNQPKIHDVAGSKMSPRSQCSLIQMSPHPAGEKYWIQPAT